MVHLLKFVKSSWAKVYKWLKTHTNRFRNSFLHAVIKLLHCRSIHQGVVPIFLLTSLWALHFFNLHFHYNCNAITLLHYVLPSGIFLLALPVVLVYSLIVLMYSMIWRNSTQTKLYLLYLGNHDINKLISIHLTTPPPPCVLKGWTLHSLPTTRCEEGLLTRNVCFFTFYTFCSCCCFLFSSIFRFMYVVCWFNIGNNAQN